VSKLNQKPDEDEDTEDEEIGCRYNDDEEDMPIIQFS
jgi:hypothetical protein